MKPRFWTGAGLCAGVVVSFFCIRAGEDSTPLETSPALSPSIKTGPLPTAETAPPLPQPPRQLTDSVLEAQIQKLRQSLAPGGVPLDKGSVLKIVTAWAVADPLAAAKFIEDSPRFPSRADNLALALGYLEERSPGDGLRWLSEHVATADQHRARYAFLNGLVLRKSPRLAGVLASQEEFNSYLVDRAIQVVAEEGTNALVALYPAVRDEMKGRVAEALAEQLAATDLPAAVEWLSRCKERSPWGAGKLLTEVLKQNPGQFAQVVQAVKATDHEVALLWHNLNVSIPEIPAEWLQAAPPNARTRLLSRWGAEHCERRPEQVVSTIKRFLPADQQVQALESAFAGWMESDRKGATEWMQAQGDPALAEVRGLIELNGLPPEERLRRAGGLTSPGAKAACMEALMEVVYSEPATAAAWVGANLQEVDRRSAARVAELYFERDEVAAAEWLAKLPACESRPGAVMAAVEHWAAAGEGVLAVETLAAVPPSERAACAVRAFQSAYSKHPQAAATLADSQGWSAETRAVLRAWVAGDERNFP